MGTPHPLAHSSSFRALGEVPSDVPSLPLVLPCPLTLSNTVGNVYFLSLRLWRYLFGMKIWAFFYPGN